ncbi:FN3 domain-containing metallophosphoesterase family protein [Desulfoluna butyratoxydans]|uniref:Fibronectin type iii n=1 Tax=Desulfoluna butyratoxydans TaxID=231438 RepID=A0A4U8YT25_9BACT|nr:FN3 domain-containing metallophosphoesterase family protein [Desulfoluna butyratoxydans]VFQ45002.1 fibronectin type iii [Desulfoluna butyratoxydans]
MQNHLTPRAAWAILIFSTILVLTTRPPAFADFGRKANLDFIVAPYLIKPGPETMTVMFEAFCLSPTLLVQEAGTFSWDRVDTRITPVLPTLYKARLTGLKPDTTYLYRVETIFRRSPVYRFHTWPEAAGDTTVAKLVAISDSQGDHPERLADVVTNGIIAVEGNGSADACAETLSALLITGDLVTNGDRKSQWTDEFFANLQPLASRVPLIPALGNHDMTPFFYACYFDMLPDGSLESCLKLSRYNLLNTMVLTLNSNDLIQIEGLPDAGGLLQREWLLDHLYDAQDDPATDFVLAQFHHPCKSELWPPGEAERSCRFVAMLERFTADTGKPSVHLFGHTHAYSRGQSRDMPHVWLNVAPTAGDIDYWGEYDMSDYDEIQKSVDEFGYCLITIQAGYRPSVQVVRRSGGNGIQWFHYTDDTISDAFTIRRDNQAPETPVITATEHAGDLLLNGTAFNDPDGDSHLESHWQLLAESGDKIIDMWGNRTRAENIWMGENSQEGVDITAYRITDLSPGTYGARVRYRDEGFTWSSWSETISITIPCTSL